MSQGTSHSRYCKWTKEHKAEKVPIRGFFCSYCGRDQIIGLRLEHYIVIAAVLALVLIVGTVWIGTPLLNWVMNAMDTGVVAIQSEETPAIPQTTVIGTDSTTNLPQPLATIGQFPQPHELTPIAWGAQNGEVVFASRTDTNSDDVTDLQDRSSIFFLDLQTGQLISLTQSAFYSASPDWAPYGKRIAFASAREDSNGDTKIDANDVSSIYIQSIGAETAQRLTARSVDYREPDWSPNGDQIAAVCEQRALCVISLGAGHTARFDFNSLDSISDPIWYNISTVLFVGHQTDVGISQIFSLDLNRGVADPISSNEMTIEGINLSPIESILAGVTLDSTESLSHQMILTMDLGGNQVSALPVAVLITFGAFDPSWSPTSLESLIFAGVYSDTNGDGRLDEYDDSRLSLWDHSTEQIFIVPSAGGYDREPDWHQ